MLRMLWNRVRSCVPVSCYRWLARTHRWERSRAISRLGRQDKDYLHLHPDVLVPDALLRFNVVGSCTIPEFLEDGHRITEDIESALGMLGISAQPPWTFLDFGCGCGRLLIALRNRCPQWHIHGTDVDSRAVAWCAAHLPEFKMCVNESLPPLSFPENMFDLIWSGSVFTHLDEGRQDAWLAELRRVLKPSGILLATVHGPHCWNRLPFWTLSSLKHKGFLYVITDADKGIHPDWYQVAWHTETYIRSHWSRYLEIHGYIPQGCLRYHDLVLARKPPDR